MKNSLYIATSLIIIAATNVAFTQDKIELETTVIKGNTELPKILYVVPWQNTTEASNSSQQKLALHSLFGDLFEPYIPESPAPLDE